MRSRDAAQNVNDDDDDDDDDDDNNDDTNNVKTTGSRGDLLDMALASQQMLGDVLGIDPSQGLSEAFEMLAELQKNPSGNAETDIQAYKDIQQKIDAYTCQLREKHNIKKGDSRATGVGMAYLTAMHKAKDEGLSIEEARVAAESAADAVFPPGTALQAPVSHSAAGAAVDGAGEAAASVATVHARTAAAAAAATGVGEGAATGGTTDAIMQLPDGILLRILFGQGFRFDLNYLCAIAGTCTKWRLLVVRTMMGLETMFGTTSTPGAGDIKATSDGPPAGMHRKGLLDMYEKFNDEHDVNVNSSKSTMLSAFCLLSSYRQTSPGNLYTVEEMYSPLLSSCYGVDCYERDVGWIVNPNARTEFAAAQHFMPTLLLSLTDGFSPAKSAQTSIAEKARGCLCMDDGVTHELDRQMKAEGIPGCFCGSSGLKWLTGKKEETSSAVEEGGDAGAGGENENASVVDDKGVELACNAADAIHQFAQPGLIAAATAEWPIELALEFADEVERKARAMLNAYGGDAIAAQSRANNDSSGMPDVPMTAAEAAVLLEGSELECFIDPCTLVGMVNRRLGAGEGTEVMAQYFQRNKSKDPTKVASVLDMLESLDSSMTIFDDLAFMASVVGNETLPTEILELVLRYGAAESWAEAVEVVAVQSLSAVRLTVILRSYIRASKWRMDASMRRGGGGGAGGGGAGVAQPPPDAAAFIGLLGEAVDPRVMTSALLYLVP